MSCCLIHVGTGRDLSLQYSENINPENHNAENINPKNHNSNIEYIVELNEYGLIVDEKINWLATQYPYVVLHNHVVMPNHFHIILEIDS